MGRGNGESMSTTTAHALIKATSLNRYYGSGKSKHHAVKDFNLELHKGEVLGLLGPNGAGKSTTMQMLTGNISPSSGSVIINGVNLIDEPMLAKRSIGYLPEQPPIYRDMNSVEFLHYCAMLHDIPNNQKNKAVENTLDRCGLQNVRQRLIANLSKGYQQRVGIAQAILHQPDVVILDEPTVGLDPIQITQIRQLIRELGNDHSVILSTHILPEVQAVCDRVQIINQGKTVFSDSFEKLSKKQKASEVIVGFDNDIDQKILEVIEGVKKVEGLGGNRFRLSFSELLNTKSLFELAQKKGWQLNELTPETNTLEQIFMNLIHSDAMPPSPSNPIENSTITTNSNNNEAA